MILRKNLTVLSFSITLLIFGFLSVKVARADSYVHCESGTWAEVPMLQSDIFTGSISGTCDLILIEEGSLKALGGYYQKKSSQLIPNALGVQHIFEGPVPDVLEGLPVVRYDEEVQVVEGNLRKEVRLGGNGTDLFLYSAHSKGINFIGLSAYLRKLDIDFKVEKISKRRFKLFLMSSTHIQKPAYVFASVFLTMAKNKSLAQFQIQIQALAQDVAEHL